MQAYKTKRVTEQPSIHQLCQSNASRQQHEYWKSRIIDLSYSTDYPSQMHHYRDARCSCDTCSLIKAQEMDRYYSTQGQSPLYLTSWPLAKQPRTYKQGFQPVQGSNLLQTRYQEIRQSSHPRAIPLMFTPQPAHPLPTAPHQILHPAGYSESRTYLPTPEIHVNLSTQLQGSAPNAPNIVPTTPQKIPHPAGHPEAGTCPLSEIHDASPPSALKASPTLLSNGSVIQAPLRSGGVAYDHHDLPKIVAVHSLPSSPVFVREKLKTAALLPMGSQEPYDRNSGVSLPRPSLKVEHRYSNLEPSTDTVVGAENTCDPLGKMEEKMNDFKNNSKDLSNMILVKCEPVSPKFQSHPSPNQYMPQHRNDVLADTTVGQEKALQPKDFMDQEMKIRTLLKRINAWQIDFNEETDDIKKWKILNLIIEGRTKLEKMRLKRNLTNTPNPEELRTSGVRGNSDDKEVANSDASNEHTTVVETTGSVITLETNSDITDTTASDVESRIEYATSQNMKLEEKGIPPKSAMEIHSGDVREPSVTMETGSDMRMSTTKTNMETESDELTSPQITMDTDSDIMMSLPKPTMETESDELTSPQITTGTEITMEPRIDEEKTTGVAMKADSCVYAPGTDAVCANMISSPFRVESTASSVIKTNTDVVYSTNASTTPLISTNVTIKTSNIDMTTDGGAMATDDSDPSYRNSSRTSSASPDDFADTDFSISFETNPLLNMASPCHANPTNVENCVKSIVVCNKDIVNRILDENLNQIHEEQISSMNSERSQRLSPALLSVIKDPFATTEIKRKEQAGYSKGSESDSNDVWTMELDENSQKAVFRRRWKRTGGHFDWKSSALESQTIDENEEKELIHSDEWFSKSNECSPPSKKRALLEQRIVDNEDQNDDDDDEQIMNKAIKISPTFKNLISGGSKRSIHSGQEPTSLLYPTEKSELTEDLLASDLETADSPANESSQCIQDGGVEEATSEEDFEESIFMLKRSLQLRESKIQRLNEKKEQLLDELKRIKASTPSSITRDL